MAIGDTVQAGLMRVDFSPIQRAGEAQARANQAFGQAIGNVLDKFYEKKREKAQQESIADTLVSTFGVNREEANHLSKNKEFIPTFFEQQKAQRDYQLQLDKFNQASALRNLQMDQIRRNMERQEDADLLAKEARQKEEAQAQIYDQFLSGREMVDMQLGRTDTNPLMRNVPGPTTQVPQGEYKGNRFFQTEQGKSDFTSLVDAGIDASDALEMASKREAQLLESQPKAPDMFKLSDEIRKATEFQQGQDAITFTPERNTIVLGDTAYGISGKFGNEAEVIKLKSVEIPNYSNMNSVMNQLISLGEKRKTTKFMSNADKTLAQSLSNQLRGLLREQILGPGTVTDPERAILNEIVQNPTTWMDTAGNTQSKIDSLKGIRKDAFNKLKTRLTGLGLNVAEIGQGDESSFSKSSVNFDQETPSGLGYTEINLDQL
jgi:hypothetical protein